MWSSSHLQIDSDFSELGLDLRLPDLPINFILEEIAETKDGLTFKQVSKEEEDNFKNARQALKNYEDWAILA
jgi:hypothetical protein